MTYTAARIMRAFRDVVLYLLADAFDLAAPEIVLSGLELDQILLPYGGGLPERHPVAVAEELTSGRYSTGLDARLRQGRETSRAVADDRTKRAPALVWAASLANFVAESYGLDETETLVLRLRLVSLLERELGVGAAANQRASAYLPNDVRLLLVGDGLTRPVSGSAGRPTGPGAP